MQRQASKSPDSISGDFFIPNPRRAAPAVTLPRFQDCKVDFRRGWRYNANMRKALCIFALLTVLSACTDAQEPPELPPSNPEITKKVQELLTKLKVDEEDTSILVSVESSLEELSQEAVGPLITAIKEGNNWKIRGIAAKVLGKIGDTKAVPFLIETLNSDKESKVRAWAAFALRELKDKRSLPALLRALKDEDSTVRDWSVLALGQVGDAKAVLPLIEVMKGDKEASVRAFAAKALGEISDKQAVEPLISTLHDEDGLVKTYTAESLGSIGDKRAVAPLCKMLSKEIEKPEFFEAPLGSESRNSIVCSAALLALGDIGGDKAFEVITQALQDKSPQIRMAAVTALGRIDDDRKLELLLKLLKDESPTIRSTAAVVLGRVGGEASVEPLLKVLDDEEAGVRMSAAIALWMLGNKKAADPLAKLWKEDEDKKVQLYAAYALYKIRETKVVLDFLIEALKDNDISIRESVTRMLKDLTKQDFGTDYKKWKEWYEKNKDE